MNDTTPTTTQEYRSGFVAVVGRPNVGKSTLINALIGTQVAIASSRPETTRKAIRGILTTPHAQMVLLDTPGIHRPRTLLGQRLNDVVDESLSEVDGIAFLLPADQEIGAGDRRILSRLRSQFWKGPWPHDGGETADRDATGTSSHGDARLPAAGKSEQQGRWSIPVVAIVTKIDTLSRPKLVAKLIEIDTFADFTAMVPVSALEDDNLTEVRDVLLGNLPEGPQMYPEDQVSEERPGDQIAELVRGAFLEELDDELPHSLAVVVDDIESPRDRTQAGLADDGKTHVMVSIYVERDSQKPIIIGHRAQHLVQVKKKLRTAVNRIVGAKAKLELHVKVAKEWQSDPKQLERLGF
ncbi:GTPase Era [Bifidobacterium mongoliense]|uniref:GTPase Era n=1 Tax=Bifidobacterium mongoliense TaxID=518643 RepID=UPI0026481B71|nr:GTPase Era [Bifidobacterium mongoliense]MDN6025904.1 GTPase Era [Bifidobacterium mongoliense]MDN6051826.1 GTPase Era [Bifidobacterium mongoliense]MDN6720423.1 GTPase Era [Bifidobacterium mongoliense]